MDRFIGVDVGKNKYFVVCYSENGKNLTKYFFENSTSLKATIKPTKQDVIAIDSPPRPRSAKNKRKAEIDLGIGGYYATPYEEKRASSWMISGFDLWKRLESKSRLIEVHPTAIFKKLKNPDKPSNRWLGMHIPRSKNTKEGISQRKSILKELLPNNVREIDQMKIDELDALIAAYTAEGMCNNKAVCYCDEIDGFIYFPK